jgi:uncharacterized repeat protein (TIGR01451 family)
MFSHYDLFVEMGFHPIIWFYGGQTMSTNSIFRLSRSLISFGTLAIVLLLGLLSFVWGNAPAQAVPLMMTATGTIFTPTPYETPFPTVQNDIDLVFSFARIEMPTFGSCYASGNAEMRTSITFYNNSEYPLSNFWVSVNGENRLVRSIAARQSMTLSFAGYQYFQTTTVLIDATNAIGEKDEVNNYFSGQVPIPTLPPYTCTPQVTPQQTFVAPYLPDLVVLEIGGLVMEPCSANYGQRPVTIGNNSAYSLQGFWANDTYFNLSLSAYQEQVIWLESSELSAKVVLDPQNLIAEGDEGNNLMWVVDDAGANTSTPTTSATCLPATETPTPTATGTETLTPTPVFPTVEGAGDLQVVSMVPSQKSLGNGCFSNESGVYVSIYNAGSTVANNFYVRVSSNSTFGQELVTAIAPNTYRYVWIPGSYYYHAEAFVDATNVVPESNEANNLLYVDSLPMLSAAYTCTPTVGTPTPPATSLPYTVATVTPTAQTYTPSPTQSPTASPTYLTDQPDTNSFGLVGFENGSLLPQPINGYNWTFTAHYESGLCTENDVRLDIYTPNGYYGLVWLDSQQVKEGYNFVKWTFWGDSNFQYLNLEEIAGLPWKMVLTQSCYPYYIPESKTYTFYLEQQPRSTSTPNPLTPTDTLTPTASTTPTLTLTPSPTFTGTPVQGVSMNVTGYRGHNGGANCTTTASSPFSAEGNGDAVTFCVTLANGSLSALSDLSLYLTFPWNLSIPISLEGGALQPNEQELFAIETTIDQRWIYQEQVYGSINGYLGLPFQLLGDNLSQQATVLIDYVRQTPTPDAPNDDLTATITATPTAEPWSAFFLSSSTSATWTLTPANGTTVTPSGNVSPTAYTPFPTVIGATDLQIVSAGPIHQYLGNGCYLANSGYGVTIANTGNVATAGFYVNLLSSFNAYYPNSLFVSSLAPNSNTSIWFSGHFASDVHILVDSSNTVAETNEENNYLHQTNVPILTAPYTCTPTASTITPTWTPTPANGTTVTPETTTPTWTPTPANGTTVTPSTITPTATPSPANGTTVTPVATQVSGTVWLDLNRDHQRQTSEPLMGAIGYELWRDADQNGQAETYVSAGTSEFGVYRLNLTASTSQGQLYIKFKLPEKHEFASPNVGSDSTDSDVDSAGWYLLMSGGVFNAAPDVGIRPIANSNLTISQVQDRSIAPINSQVVFRIFVTNQGTTPLTNIQVQNVLSNGLILISVQSTHGSPTLTQDFGKMLGLARPNLAGATVSIPNLSPGETATITLNTQLQGTVVVGQLLTSNASASTSNLAAQSANVASVMAVPNEVPNTGFSVLVAIIVFSGVFLLVIGALIIRKSL